MRKIINEMKLRLPARSVNEAVTRSCISAFIAEANPTVEELCDLRCAVSEAVTNSIVHAYRGREGEACYVYISVRLYDSREVSVEVSDNGCGIEDVERARTPLFTTGDPSERCGMGFLVMDNFTDSLTVRSTVGKGTRVLMWKKLAPATGEK
jgi:stage II sporulation protein AB (anti-sigma F factor)